MELWLDIHLDPLGGWAGDMFVAAMLDAFPEHWPAVQAAITALGLGAGSECRLIEHRDAALTGRRFLVAAEAEEADPRHAHEHPAHHHKHEHHKHEHHHHDHHHHEHGHRHGHGEHRAWSDIRRHLEASRLGAATKRHAVGIFSLLAEAEAEVHGVQPGEVMFHEVGAVDSIVDIVAAAEIVGRLDARSWTSAPLPLGSGRIRSQHGILPVPAPATALLMRGLATIDDGIPGERVTPTGAAVARYLLGGSKSAVQPARRLVRTGTGFGQRHMPGIANCLRVLAFEPLPGGARRAGGDFGHRELAVIGFEVDDQSAEDLAAGLDHLRALPGIHDVVQSAVFGKKGRLATHVQVLAAPEHLDDALAACFEETTTIGLRYHLVQGAALGRSFEEVETPSGLVRVKAVRRPNRQASAKGEAADVAAVRGHEARVRLRREAEAVALVRIRRDGEHE